MRQRWARWTAAVLIVLTGAFVVLSQLAPSFIRERLVEQLTERFDAPVDVGRIEIHYLRLAVSVHELQLEREQLALTVDEVEVDWPLQAFVRSDARPIVNVVAPQLVYEADRSRPEDEEPKKIQLDAFDALQITGGAVTVRLVTHSGPTELALTDVEARLDNPLYGSSQMGTRISLDAALADGGLVSVEGQVSSTEPRLAWRIRFEVDAVQLTPFNNLLADIVEMDVESGALSVKGELLRTADHLRGRVSPQFEDLVMFTPGEEAEHAMGEALFGHMLASANSTIEVNRSLDVGSTLTFNKLLSADWKDLVGGLIQRGYSRRLGTLDGYEAKIGDVEIDFGMGLLTLLDVELVNDSHRIDVPFVSVPRIDVIFDEEVTKRDATAYKHVTLWEPTLNFVAGETGKESQIKFDDRWVDKISALPFKTRDLVVHAGRVVYRDERHEEPVQFFVSDIELNGVEMAEGLHGQGYRGARLSGSGQIMGTALATIAVAYEPRAPAPNIDLDLYVPPLGLETLNPVLNAYAEVEAASGSLGFSARITARQLQVDASVVPTVVAPKLRRVEGSRHKLRHVMLERRIKKLRGRAIDISFGIEPGEGVLHEFFPEFLIAAIRER